MLIGFIYSKLNLFTIVIKLDIAILRLPAKRLSYCTKTNLKSKRYTSFNKFYTIFSIDSSFTLKVSTIFINAIN